MLRSILIEIFLISILNLVKDITSIVPNVVIQGIEPNSGPDNGQTKVLVRLKEFDKSLVEIYPHPKCRFGSNQNTVNATFLECSSHPRKIGEKEPRGSELNETCIACEYSPPHKADYVPFTVSLLGDFSDVQNSVPFRYYKDPIVYSIKPRYGPKDGGTMVEVYGENFLNFDQNLRCGFGSIEVKAYYVNENYLICYSPKSDVTGHKLPFTVSLNNQQNSLQNVPYVYYQKPQIYRLEPNRGPDTGGTLVRIRGDHFNPMKNIPDMNNYNETFCTFGNVSLSLAKVISSTDMECVSPPSYVERQLEVEITLNNREWTDDGRLFYYYHPPFIYFIYPKIGPVSGGTVVTIVGSNFENTGYVMCRFGDKYSKGEYISVNELKCVSPQVEKPGIVGLSVAIREDEFSSGINTKYKYYALANLDSISPMCGPERGFTQLTLYGKNFPVDDTEVKCVFNRTVFTNATVMSDQELKCDSPSVLNYDGVNENNVTEYDIEITMNGVDFDGPKRKFYYYVETNLWSVTPQLGPVEGGTLVKLQGGDFTQRGACNTTIRFSTYHVKPQSVSQNTLEVLSPRTNLTGAVVVSVALNGRDFEKDITVNLRNPENTFYYYKHPMVSEFKPTKASTIGGTPVDIFGVGFLAPYQFTKDPEMKKMYYKFIDANDNSTEYFCPDGKNSTLITENHLAHVSSPRVAKNGTEANVYVSFNGQDYERIPHKFLFYMLPNITDISPRYGPLVTNDWDRVELKLDNYYCKENCDNMICRYKSATGIYYEKGQYVRPGTVNCTVPKVNTPQSFDLEVSFNGEDYTNNGFNYTFYDPHIVSVEPQMVSSKGGTKIKIKGYGFAPTGENLKVKFGSRNNDIKCNAKTCIKNVDFINENLIEVETYPRSEIFYEKTGLNMGYERFPVEVSVYNDDFTNNNVTIFYYDEPSIINNVYDPSVKLDAKTKLAISDSLIKTLPCNTDTMIPIPVDSSKILESYSQIYHFTNYTCKYTLKNDTGVYKITSGYVTNLGNAEKNVFFCQSPQWDYTGESKIQISFNGYDFSESQFDFVFTDALNILKIEPPCGPLNGGTIVRLYGTGFEQRKDFVFKWGTQNLVDMESSSFLQPDTTMNIGVKSNYQIQKIMVRSPQAPFTDKTLGGSDYIGVSKMNTLPIDSKLLQEMGVDQNNPINQNNQNNENPYSDASNKFYPNNYVSTNFEFYYYKQPYVQNFIPKGSVVSGGTKVLVIGAWFDYKPMYGVKPYCKFGDKIVEGEFLSTVRISCVAPNYNEPNVRVPFCVSLNKYDFVCTKNLFTYYNDFNYAKFENMVPQSGPDVGGTQIKIFGKNFTNLVTPEEFLCGFFPEDQNIPSKSVPAGYQEYPKSNLTAIICNSPGGWSSGTKAKIKITFDGQNFMDTGFDFYFFKINSIKPLSGPTTGGQSINVYGGGFKNSSKVKCQLDGVDYKPMSINEHLINCPLPAVYNKNFTGAVDLGFVLNGIDTKSYPKGFYYYEQISVDSIYPANGPSKGNALVKVYGKKFRSDFPGSEPGCKLGSFYGRGEVVTENEMNCYFSSLPLLDNNQTLNFSAALNNYTFTDDQGLTFTPYGIKHISPSSGPISGNTRIEITGSGFFPSKKIRCRFGVPGYYFYTSGDYIDHNTIVCSSPNDFKIPAAAQLPFTVPFSIAFNDDEFEPWTSTSHFFSFYDNYYIKSVFPAEGSTKSTTEVKVYADEEKPFAMRKFNFYKKS
jgi:hypothetical protein